MNPRRRESPMPRKLPNGKTVWLARYTGRDGLRRYWKPEWNRGSATFKRKRDAQTAIDEAYERVYGLGLEPTTFGAYFEVWPARYPRSERTNKTNVGRIKNVLDLDVLGRPLRAWPMDEFRRRHAYDLVDKMLREQGRATTGAVNILRALSVMVEDAITDEVCEVNGCKGVRVRRNDPRATRKPREPRVFSFEEMHTFAAAGRAETRARTRRLDRRGKKPVYYSARNYEPMLRTFTDTGLRLGEVLALRRADFDGEVFMLRGNAHDGTISEGDTDTKDHTRTVPCGPTLAAMIRGRPPRIDTDVLFPTPTGKVWRERNFYREVWDPARQATGMDIRPHDCRNSWVTHLHALGINEADLADAAGHGIETMLGRYTHPLSQSHDAIRKAIG